ncbi:MAG TPA: hypothetical protein VMF64_01130 [Steroidobacteraceae bacterium]|nr:hypothetical protein [Steroidobacteraceae bacterium]
MNHSQGSRPARRPVSVWHVGLAALAVSALALLPRCALAQVAATVSATGQYQYNSNVFDLQRGFLPAPNYYSDAASYYAYAAGVNLNDQISQQNIYLRGTDTEYKYDHFDLSHNEYALDAGWVWKVGDDLNGTFDVSRARTMVPFQTLTTLTTSALQLYISTDQRESATAAYQFTSEWAVDANAYTDRFDEPLLGEPDLRLADSGAGLALRVGGNGELKGALTADYQHGDYANAILYLSPAYNQWDWGIGGTYQPVPQGSPTIVDFSFGETTRSSTVGYDNASGWTGHLNFTRALTGKTTVKLSLLRDLTSYLATAAAETDTAATLSANWQATFKTGLGLAYTVDYTVYPNYVLYLGGPPGNRGDHYQYATVTVNYATRRWLTIVPYLIFQTRRSNLYGANFNATQYGVSFTLAWQNRLAAAAAVPLAPSFPGGPVGPAAPAVP